MDQKETLNSPFSIENILLIKSSFSRVTNVHFGQEIVEAKTDVNVNVEIMNTETSVVTETVSYKQINKETQEVEVDIEVVMAGIFKRIKENPITLVDFSYVNGAALMFPYIREHITALTIKSGIGAVFLSPVDFTKYKPVQQP